VVEIVWIEDANDYAGLPVSGNGVVAVWLPGALIGSFMGRPAKVSMTGGYFPLSLFSG